MVGLENESGVWLRLGECLCGIASAIFKLCGHNGIFQCPIAVSSNHHLSVCGATRELALL